MKKIFIFAIVIIALILIIVAVDVQMNKKTVVATFGGWLFEVEINNGTKKFLVRDDREQPSILNETEIIKQARSKKWPKHSVQSLAEWQKQCDQVLAAKIPCTQEQWQKYQEENCKNNPQEKICLGDFEYWKHSCETNNATLSCTLLPYEKYQKLMEDYLKQNNLQGKIIKSYVAIFPIYGT